MSRILASLNRRLAKVEPQVADRAKRAELASCVSCKFTLVLPSEAEEFGAQMNRTCPAHGFRNLGRINPVVFVKPDLTFTEDSTKLLQLVERYEVLRSQHSKSGARV